MDYNKLREEPLKSAVQQDYFKAYKYTQLGNIDFVIAKHNTEKGMHSLFEEEGIDGSIKSILWFKSLIKYRELSKKRRDFSGKCGFYREYSVKALQNMK